MVLKSNGKLEEACACDWSIEGNIGSVLDECDGPNNERISAEKSLLLSKLWIFAFIMLDSGTSGTFEMVIFCSSVLAELK